METTNIKVVVRIRPRNEKEIKENSPIAIVGNGKEVIVKDNKTFAFDQVFGPASTQEQIYQSVVVPALKNVLDGYNCTIFAYGQTGTGKTHTMEGDMGDHLTENSGIIPRTLFNLFEYLEKDEAEYSVRVSFIEIYNEELKDLLSINDDKKLKLFGKIHIEVIHGLEDNSKKGTVIISGLEEVLVANVKDVISVMQTGSVKRRIASTNFNEKSSRSHTIFTITIHLKEVTPEGEDLLKVGKLHLVDLAGSENIGRSGAKKARAMEPRMIHQSLLTLGRVINALVENSSHIPYRESKLTRLLQDSLGGRTCTCIIATLSPAKCNLEESNAALDYAHRAKNIRNRPEINQKMTKRTLIKEYVSEIDRLKSELNANREKNGVYLTKENFDNLTNESLSRKDHIEELKMGSEVLKEQISDLKLKLEKSIADHGDVTKELERVEMLLSEQRVISRTHQLVTSKVDATARHLLMSLNTSMNDIDTLYSKLEKKANLEINNKEEMEKLYELVKSNLFNVRDILTKNIDERAVEMLDLSKAITELNQNSLNGYKALNDVNNVNVDKRINTTQKLVENISENGDKITNVLNQFLEQMKYFSDSLGSLNEQSMVNTDAYVSLLSSSTFDDFLKTLTGHAKELNDAFSRLDSTVKLHCSSFDSRCNKLIQDQENCLSKQVETLQKENELMKTMIATQGDLQSVWKEKIKNQFDSMLNDCFKEQNNSLTKAASQFYKLNDTGLNEITEFGKMLKTNIITQLEEVDKIKTESTVTSEFITEKWTEHHNDLEIKLRSAKNQAQYFKSEQFNHHKNFNRSNQESCLLLTTLINSGLSEVSDLVAKTKEFEQTEQEVIQHEKGTIVDLIQSSSAKLEESMADINNKVKDLNGNTDAIKNDFGTVLEKVVGDVSRKRLLVDDSPVPNKRQQIYPTKWIQMPNLDVLRKECKFRGKDFEEQITESLIETLVGENDNMEDKDSEDENEENLLETKENVSETHEKKPIQKKLGSRLPKRSRSTSSTRSRLTAKN